MVCQYQKQTLKAVAMIAECGILIMKERDENHKRLRLFVLAMGPATESDEIVTLASMNVHV